MNVTTEVKHTPGPWSNTPLQDTIWANSGNTKVCTVADLPWKEHPITGRRSSDAETEQANARLIAAAPELLEACKMLSSLAPSNEGIGGHAPIGAFFIAAQKARAAIAKAEGRD
jgi:hypothetical protein